MRFKSMESALGLGFGWGEFRGCGIQYCHTNAYYFQVPTANASGKWVETTQAESIRSLPHRRRRWGD